MYKRFLISMTAIVAFSLAIFVQAGSAKPIPGIQPLSSSSHQYPSQAPSGMSNAEFHALMIRSQALNQKYGVVQSRPIVSEKIGGLELPPPSTTQVASSGSDFDWGDAGIGAGVVFGTMLLGAGLLLTVRRRGYPIAH
jgi:hypothetical protein